MASHEKVHDPEVKRKTPTTVSMDHIEIHPAMGGGHRVEAHYANRGMDGYKEPEKKDFAGPHAKVSVPKGHILHHVAQSMGVPVDVAGPEDAENHDGTNT